MILDMVGSKKIDVDIDVSDIQKTSMEAGSVVSATVVANDGGHVRLAFDSDRIKDQKVPIEELGDLSEDIKVGDKIVFQFKGVNENKIELKVVKIEEPGL